MLVLSRKQGQEVVIDDKIRLTVLAIRGNKVCLGLSAPPNVSIQREEIHCRRCVPHAGGFGPTKEASR